MFSSPVFFLGFAVFLRFFSGEDVGVVRVEWTEDALLGDLSTSFKDRSGGGGRFCEDGRVGRVESGSCRVPLRLLPPAVAVEVALEAVRDRSPLYVLWT